MPSIVGCIFYDVFDLMHIGCLIMLALLHTLASTPPPQVLSQLEYDFDLFGMWCTCLYTTLVYKCTLRHHVFVRQ